MLTHTPCVPDSVTAVTVTDTLWVIFVFALFVPASGGFGLGLTKINNQQVCGVGEHLCVFSRGGGSDGW